MTHPVNLDTIPSSELAELFLDVRGEMYDRKMTEEHAEMLAEHPKLVQQCEEMVAGARNHFTFGIVNVDVERPDRHPSYVQIRSADTSHMIRLLLVGQVTPLELAKAIIEAHQSEVGEL